MYKEWSIETKYDTVVQKNLELNIIVSHQQENCYGMVWEVYGHRKYRPQERMRQT